ncbi:hypothetical protein T11_3615 [Trichinella zimbabwensis]|uniref:Uncharacterized protein n=1 Tax=Trichinella zimbabwensis TaxID=268475 RepID=A0A0V1HQ49_9BILA|nr:hypothetical protein T11_3615 [Trichinella zimbabwensis]
MCGASSSGCFTGKLDEQPTAQEWKIVNSSMMGKALLWLYRLAATERYDAFTRNLDEHT